MVIFISYIFPLFQLKDTLEILRIIVCKYLCDFFGVGFIDMEFSFNVDSNVWIRIPVTK